MLEHQDYLVKERVAFLKTTDTYDIFEPETGQQIGIAHEKPGPVVSALRPHRRGSPALRS